MTDEELKMLENFKVYVFEGEVYVKAEDYKKKSIMYLKLKEENKRLKEEIGKWERQEYIHF